MTPLPTLTRRLGAEAIGTFFLLATVVGSGIMADTLSGGNTAIALLANTIATGAILYVLIKGLGPVSGAHFNPAVTLVFWLRRSINGREAVFYSLIQIIAGVLGVFTAHLMFDLPIFQTGSKIRAGNAQVISEVIATFGLIFTILTVLKAKEEAVAMAVGLYITAAYWFTASTSFANPAVTIARSLSDSFAGIRPVDAPYFIAAQLTGALLAAFLCRWLLTDQAED